MPSIIGSHYLQEWVGSARKGNREQGQWWIQGLVWLQMPHMHIDGMKVAATFTAVLGNLAKKSPTVRRQFHTCTKFLIHFQRETSRMPHPPYLPQIPHCTTCSIPHDCTACPIRPICPTTPRAPFPMTALHAPSAPSAPLHHVLHSP